MCRVPRRSRRKSTRAQTSDGQTQSDGHRETQTARAVSELSIPATGPAHSEIPTGRSPKDAGCAAHSAGLANPARTERLDCVIGPSLPVPGSAAGGGTTRASAANQPSNTSAVHAAPNGGPTAAGEIVGASASNHPDLFWALRGGGGNFGGRGQRRD
jgi:hypothetical protein